MALTAGKFPLAILLALLAAGTVFSQAGDSIPHATYYAALQSVYAGEYRDAARELAREAQRGVHTTQARWIDSICYYAMLGEVLYHQGRNAEALAQFDQACQILLAYPDWLLQLRFQQPPRPDPNRMRRAPTWGRSQRTFVLGQVPATEQVLIGDIDANRRFETGGVVRTPMLWRVNVIEVVRMSALTIRRRNEILGPLSAQDPITRQLSTVLAGGNLAPANHWSIAFIDLLRGLAQEGAGKLDEADMLYGRSLVIDGQFDHPLTCIGLLGQGRIAAIKGDPRRATRLFTEAGFSAFYFEDWDVLTESTLHGWINHLASGTPGVYPPLDPIASWGQTNRLQHIAIKLRLAEAESLLWLGELTTGAGIVDEAGRRIGQMRTGLPGIHLLYLQAVVQLLQNRLESGGEALSRAVAAQAGVSLRIFQTLRVNAMYDSGAASPRVAVDLYAKLLADPLPADWTRNPLDAMAVLQTVEDAAFDRWFLAAAERKDASVALGIAEQAKRRRYLASQPFGGRLLALRAILESPEADLSADGLAQRQQILATYPVYRALATAGQKLYNQLQASPVLASTQSDAKPLNALYDQWDRNAIERQHMLAQLAVRRLASSLEFPPTRTTAELQSALGRNESLIVFHTFGDSLCGFLVTKSSVNIWKLPDPRRLKTGIGSFLRALGNYGANRDLSFVELKSDAWRKDAEAAYTAIFKDARLDLSKTSGLVIVPDNVLWYLPFEALIPPGGQTEKVLADRFPIRYGPTAALAVSNPRPLRRAQHTGILPGDMKFAGDEPDRARLLQELVGAVTGPLLLPDQLPQPARLMAPLLDGLIVLSDLSSETVGDASFLLPKSRNTKDKPSAWFSLPYGGPERLMLTGFKTEAEHGGKGPRRESSRPGTARRGSGSPGEEIFQSLCNIMSGGARTVLLTRWRTGGRTNFDLVREFAKESADSPAAEAWQRACLLARENQVEQIHEPRLKRADDAGDTPKADHPFFWAGYMLVDTGPRPEKPDAAEPPKPDAPKDKAVPPPAKPAEAGDKMPLPKAPDARPADPQAPPAPANKEQPMPAQPPSK